MGSDPSVPDTWVAELGTEGSDPVYNPAYTNCRRNLMHRLSTMRRIIRLSLAATLFIALGSIRAADLDPKTINIQLPKEIKWVATAGGSEQAVLVGDPSKQGLYVDRKSVV